WEQSTARPRLSDSMEEGTVLRWLKSTGDEVAVGEELVEIETDKANMVYESDLAGTLTEILAQEGDTLEVGAPIARVGAASEVVAGNGGAPGTASPASKARDESASPGSDADQRALERPEPAGSAVRTTPRGTATPQITPPSPAGTAVGGDGRVKASPIAKRIAQEKGVDIRALNGSGPGGRIVKADVERALAGGVGGRPP